MEIISSNIFVLRLLGLDVLSTLMLTLVLVLFCIAWGFNRISILRIRKKVNQIKDTSAILNKTLRIGKNYVLKLDLRTHHGVNMHGDLLPEDGMSYEESFEMIHPDDRQNYKDFIIKLVKEGVIMDECTFRWDVSGRKHLGEWRYMHDQGVVEYTNPDDKTPTNLFCTLTDVTERIIQEQEEAELTNKYRKMFEQSIVGLAFFDKDGRFVTVNQKFRYILNFQSEDDPFYFNASLFDMPSFRNLIDKRHIEELYFCTKSVIMERNVNCYTELRIHPIFDEKGELVYISLSIRDVTQERELYLQNKKNDQNIRSASEEIQQYETEIQYLMDTCDMRFFRTTFIKRTCTFYKRLGKAESEMGFDELIAHFIESPFGEGLRNAREYFKEPKATLTRMHPLFHEGEGLQWNFIDSVPDYNEKGELVGTYGIVRNVTKLIEKQEELKRETERAKDSGRLKSVFMANMTHEIRTPLNSIVGFSDVLPLLSSPEEKEEIVRVITNNCDMLLRLINDILAISSLDTGGIHISPQQIDFSLSFDDICESLAQRIQEPGVEFIKDNPYKQFETVIDNGRIQQVITNFVTNAVKYTHQGHIKVGYRYQNNGLYIYCEDTGEGIPKDAQDKIFERFVKLNDYIQGTGLGLSICKAIAEGCKGKIGVISEGKDRGSTFWMWIPCEVTVLKRENNNDDGLQEI